MNHFDEMTALLLLEGQVEAQRARELRAHAGGCPQCRELLLALEKEGVWLRQALAEDEESVPARLTGAPAHSAVPWGWIATLGFGAGGAYTLWSSIIEPWQAQAAQAGFTQGNVLTMLFFSGAFWKGWDAMRSLTEFLAVATLGTVVLWLLRRHLRRATIFTAVLTAVLFALALPSSTTAGETAHGKPNYTLPAGQEVKTDLIVAGDSIRIDGDVDGDLIAFCDNLTVIGHVKGDVIAFAREIRVNGPVDGNVRTWSQTLFLGATVGRNVTSWNETTEVDEHAKIGGSFMGGGRDVQVDGQVGGDLAAAGDTVEINGSLGRNATIRSSRLSLGPNSEIRGQLKFSGHHEAEISSGAKLASPIDFSFRKEGPDYRSVRYYWHRVMIWGASFLFGLAVLLLAPGFFLDATTACNRFGLATGFGILFLIATPIAAIVVCITIVGLGVGLAAILLYVISLYAAQVFVGSWVGEKLLGTSRGVGPAIGRLALGLAILRVLRMLPYAGGFVTAVVLVWGLGAMVLAVYRRIRPEQAVPAPAPAVA